MSGTPATRQFAIVALGIAAIVAWFAAGVAVIVNMLPTPNPGQEVILRGLQVTLVAGWIGTLLWLLRDLTAGNLRFLAAPVVAWVWMWVIGTLIGQVARLNMGP